MSIRIGAEEIDASSQQALTRGCVTRSIGDLSLRETSGGNQLLKLDEQIGADRQVRRLFAQEANVPKTLPLDRTIATPPSFLALMPTVGCLFRPA